MKTFDLLKLAGNFKNKQHFYTDELDSFNGDYAPLLFLFKGVKCGYGEFERLPEEEEGAGFIYNTYQMIFHKSELLILISNRDHWESQFPFQDTEDYCPYLVSENELDQDKLNKSIQKLEEVTT